MAAAFDGAGTNLVVPVHPGMRIFATQNSAAYANRHALPLSIRSRFLEVQVSNVAMQFYCSSCLEGGDH
jgi:midasin (ATPase involved in ribosome maturation)